jgi:hypothetical protein
MNHLVLCGYCKNTALEKPNSTIVLQLALCRGCFCSITFGLGQCQEAFAFTAVLAFAAIFAFAITMTFAGIHTFTVDFVSGSRLSRNTEAGSGKHPRSGSGQNKSLQSIYSIHKSSMSILIG